MHGRPLAAALVIVVALPFLLGLPLAGVALSGGDVAAHLEFPPLTRYVQHAGFSWLAFGLTGALVGACVAPFVAAIVRASDIEPTAGVSGAFPAWGWLGIAIVAAAWAVAWTRLPWLAPVQIYTFIPLWLGYIVTVNALVHWRSGQSPLTDDTGFYLALFPMSALFWWFFEYLNRFVQNWYYVGIEALGPVEYVLWSSLAFATVLPAVYATCALLRTYPRLQAGLARGARVRVLRARSWALAGLVLAALGLLWIGVWPDWTFPMLWLAPLAIIVSLQCLFGHSHAFTPLRGGDWRGLWTWALAALGCGLCWETWNYYSAAKWLYAVPFVHRFELFEMPVLGFAGYLPFGLECAVAVDLCAQLRGRRGGVTRC